MKPRHMRPRPWVFMLAVMCTASTAHAQDWLAGEYELVVPGHPVPSRFVLVITQAADGKYRDDVFAEAVDASTGRILKQPVPRTAGAYAGVRVMTAGEIAEMRTPGLLATNVRCADVDGMLLCQIPEGASIVFEGRTLQPGYFGGAMHVGLIEVRKRPSGADTQAASHDRREKP